MKLSIVTTMYHSESFLETFYSRILKSLVGLCEDYEFVFVNDGSPDNSLSVALGLMKKDAHIKVIDLSRNFGHHKAIMTGLSHTTGDLVFSIDCDLEEPPELLRVFFEEYQRQGDVDVVYGVQKNRQGSVFKRVTGNLFYRIINWLSSIEIPRDQVIARLMSRRYVDSLVQHQEDIFVIAGLWAMTGYKQVPVKVEKGYKGKSSYSLARRFAQVFFGITLLSNRPLIYISYIGAFLTSSSLFMMLVIFVRFFLYGFGVTGWTSVIISIWFFGGLNILFLGIIASYLAVIFVETKQRPYTIIRAIHEAKHD